MLPFTHRPARLPPELVARALELLAADTPAGRLAAAQLLAHGYELDEAQRRQEQAEPPPVPEGEEE